MADEADFASDYIDKQLELRLKEIRNSGEIKIGPKQCVECEEAIPDARRQLGLKLCIECAIEAERRGSLFADH